MLDLTRTAEDRGIDLEYLESIPTLLEVKGLYAEEAQLEQNFLRENLYQPSFVGRVYVDKERLILFMAFGLALQFNRRENTSVWVRPVTPCCLVDFSYDAKCSQCSEAYDSTMKFYPFTIDAGLPLVPEAERDANLEYDSGQDVFHNRISSQLEKLGVETLQTFILAGELWTFAEAYSLRGF